MTDDEAIAAHIASAIPMTYDLRRRTIAGIVAAIRAEREACAQCALKYELPDTHLADQHGRVMASLEICKAIRERTPPQPADDSKDG